MHLKDESIHFLLICLVETQFHLIEHIYFSRNLIVSFVYFTASWGFFIYGYKSIFIILGIVLQEAVIT